MEIGGGGICVGRGNLGGVEGGMNCSGGDWC